MAFSRKNQIVRSISKLKKRYQIYQKTGRVNEDVGRELKVRIERLLKRLSDG